MSFIRRSLGRASGPRTEPPSGTLPASVPMSVPTVRPLPQAVSRAVPPYLWAGASALAAFVLYVLTLAPTTSFWDASEYIATAHILGLPHPPGNPLFVVLGKVWTLLLAPTGLSVAVRMNLLAALTSAAATGFFFLVMFRILERWAAVDRPEGEEGGAAAPPAARWLPLVGAWAGSILATTAFTVWSQSTVNEKVYTPSVLIIAIVSWLTVRWLDRREEPGSARLIVLAVYLMVLGSTIHLMSLLPGPALLATVLAVPPAPAWRPPLSGTGLPRGRCRALLQLRPPAPGRGPARDQRGGAHLRFRGRRRGRGLFAWARGMPGARGQPLAGAVRQAIDLRRSDLRSARPRSPAASGSSPTSS